MNKQANSSYGKIRNHLDKINISKFSIALIKIHKSN